MRYPFCVRSLLFDSMACKNSVLCVTSEDIKCCGMWRKICLSFCMDLFSLDMVEFFSFVLTFMRISLILFLMPVFGGDSAPMQVKAALCIVLTLAVFPTLSVEGAEFPEHPFDLIIIMLGEVVMGIVFGLAIRFVFAGIQTGGQVLGFQMGFSMINIADPMTGQSVSITSHFLYMVSLLTFMTLDGHLYMIKGLADTFAVIPPGGVILSGTILDQILTLSTQMFSLAVKIAAPVLAALFLVELGLALMGRAAPQMNLLMLGFPLKIAVGFLFLGMLMVIMSGHIREFIKGLGPLLGHLLNAMSPLYN